MWYFVTGFSSFVVGVVFHAYIVALVEKEVAKVGAFAEKEAGKIVAFAKTEIEKL
jgi:hypothetical protein